MERAEFSQVYNLMIDDAEAIVHNQQVLAGVHTQLQHNILVPFEQDLIYEEHFGQRPSEPRQIRHGNTTITTRILHQAGIRLSDVNGADLLYEIEGEKFGLIQYKKSSSSRIQSDEFQLARLLDNCPDVCRYKKSRPIPRTWLPLKLNAYCGCWYGIIHNGERRYVHACEAEGIMRGFNRVEVSEFEFGLTRQTFLELFSSCRAGALIRPVNERLFTPKEYTSPLLEQQHFILTVLQRGRW
ncbi:MAG: hypothetical protein L0332_13045 [Chloroflexi bacterium]|nr:hypothetical protein [Nitrososphaera sp.]MCI0727632.1 hypothetical protein [Chloroflexota bacterium]